MVTTHVSRELLGYFHGLDDISKKRYCEKLKLCGLSEDPYIISKDKWTSERKCWPQIVFPDIYVYLVETPSPYTQASLKAFPSRVWTLTRIMSPGLLMT